MTTEIERAIIKAGGSIRDALNVALAQRDLVTISLKTEREQSAMLSIALGAIKAILSIGFSPETTMRAIDKIACEVLRLSGQIPTHTTEED